MYPHQMNSKNQTTRRNPKMSRMSYRNPMSCPNLTMNFPRHSPSPSLYYLHCCLKPRPIYPLPAATQPPPLIIKSLLSYPYACPPLPYTAHGRLPKKLISHFFFLIVSFRTKKSSDFFCPCREYTHKFPICKVSSRFLRVLVTNSLEPKADTKSL